MEFYSKSTHEYLDSLLSASHLSKTITVAFATFVITLVVAYYITRDWGVPPGPYGLPIIGYWPIIRRFWAVDDSLFFNSHLMEMKKRFGDVFSFRMTERLYVNLASLKTLREAHLTKSDCFKERPNLEDISRVFFKNGKSYDEKWYSVRKFFLNQFRDRGLNAFKENTNEVMNETTSTLIAELRELAGNPMDIQKLLVDKGNEIIWQTLLGKESLIKQSQVNYINENYPEASKLINFSKINLMHPLVRFFIISFVPKFKKAFKIRKEIASILREVVEEHKRTFDENIIRDIIDSYIKEKKDRKSRNDPTADHFDDEILVFSLLQFIGDGISGNAGFVYFFLLTLMEHPEEQEKVCEELQEVCGDRNPVLADKSKLSYTNAFIMETQRYNKYVPLFPSLQCTRETTIGDYRIPKGAITISNIYSIHHDPEMYEDPDKFNPSRFITKQEKSKSESTILFGVGKRACIGESFVMMQVFLYCTAIVKNFRISRYTPTSSPGDKESFNGSLFMELQPRK